MALIFENRQSQSINEAGLNNVFQGVLGQATKNTPKKEKDQLAKFLRDKGVDLGRSASEVIKVSSGKDPILRDPDSIVFGVVKEVYHRQGGKDTEYYHMVVADGGSGKTIIDYEIERYSIYHLICSDGEEVKSDSIKPKKFSSMTWNKWVKYCFQFYVLSISKNQAPDPNLMTRRADQRRGSDIDPNSSNYRRPANDHSRSRYNFDKSGYKKDPEKFVRKSRELRFATAAQIRKYLTDTQKKVKTLMKKLVDEFVDNAGNSSYTSNTADYRLRSIIQAYDSLCNQVSEKNIQKIEAYEAMPEITEKDKWNYDYYLESAQSAISEFEKELRKASK